MGAKIARRVSIGKCQSQVKGRQVPTHVAVDHGPEESGDEAEALEASQGHRRPRFRRDVGGLHPGPDRRDATAEFRGADRGDLERGHDGDGHRTRESPSTIGKRV